MRHCNHDDCNGLRRLQLHDRLSRLHGLDDGLDHIGAGECVNKHSVVSQTWIDAEISRRLGGMFTAWNAWEHILRRATKVFQVGRKQGEDTSVISALPLNRLWDARAMKCMSLAQATVLP